MHNMLQNVINHGVIVLRNLLTLKICAIVEETTYFVHIIINNQVLPNIAYSTYFYP